MWVGGRLFVRSPLSSFCSVLCVLFMLRKHYFCRAKLTLGAWWEPPGWGLQGSRIAQGRFRWLAAREAGHQNGLSVLSTPTACRSAHQKQQMRLFWPSGVFLRLMQAASHVYLCKFNICWVSQDLSIRLFVACVTNQLAVPHSIVMFAICPLRKYGDGRPAAVHVKQKKTIRIFLEYNIN